MTATLRRIAALVFTLAFIVTSPCLAQTAAKGPTVFAAASLKTALDAVAAAWAARTGKTPVLVYASSATLAKQIEQGAPADLFISADLVWMDELDKAGLLRAHTRHNLLGNSLVLIEPADANVALSIAPGFDLAGATGTGKIAVCTIDICPGGIYARQALQKLGVWTQVQPKLAQADNIRNALLLVARGEAAFGIVYATDAKAEPKVKIAGTFPETSHDPIIYPLAEIANSKDTDTASFDAFLSSPAADKIWNDQGFTRK